MELPDDEGYCASNKVMLAFEGVGIRLTNFKRHFDEIVKKWSDGSFVAKIRKLLSKYKKINEIDQPFIVDISGQSVVYIDNGYYIVEFTPLEQFYNVRVFLDRNAEVLGYYFDISRGNGVEENIPYYDDLYLDIIHCPADNGFTVIDDEDELLEALNTGKITREEFDFANEVCSKLFEEIQANKNIFVNMDKKELIQMWFK